MQFIIYKFSFFNQEHFYLFLDEKICDLEFGFCDWTNERDGTQLNWTRHKDDTPIDYTGPSGDHTTRTGTKQ